jgi:hypothetical protein
MASSSQARRDRRKRTAYFAGIGAHAPIEERYVDPRADGIRLYHVEVERDGRWRHGGSYGDAVVASNYAQAMRDNGAARTQVIGPRAVATPLAEDSLPIVEMRPAGTFAGPTDHCAGRVVKTGRRDPGLAIQLGLIAVSGARSV